MKQTPIWLGRKRRDTLDSVPANEEVANEAVQMERDQYQLEPLEDTADYENYHRDANNKNVNETITINFEGIEQRVQVVNQVEVDVEN